MSEPKDSWNAVIANNASVRMLLKDKFQRYKRQPVTPEHVITYRALVRPGFAPFVICYRSRLSLSHNRGSQQRNQEKQRRRKQTKSSILVFGSNLMLSLLLRGKSQGKEPPRIKKMRNPISPWQIELVISRIQRGCGLYTSRTEEKRENIFATSGKPSIWLPL